MRLRSQLSRLLLVAGLFAVLVAPARAQHVATPPCEESGAPAHSAFAAPVATADARHESHGELRESASHAPLSTPDHRSEKRENHRATPSPIVKAQRPNSQRSKSAGRNTPATPGTGQLLRMGAGTKSDLTMLEQTPAPHHMDLSSDRGPPAGDEPMRLTPAALPRPHHLQAPVPAPEPLLPRSEPASNAHSNITQPRAHACLARAALSAALPETPLRGGSRDDRAEGAVSQTRSPSGGVTS
jgi:hypothetical protein